MKINMIVKAIALILRLLSLKLSRFQLAYIKIKKYLESNKSRHSFSPYNLLESFEQLKYRFILAQNNSHFNLLFIIRVSPFLIKLKTNL